MTPFGRKLTDLVTEALKTEPSAQVVGDLIGAAIVATIKDGRDPREELPAVLDKSFAIVFSNPQQRPS